MPTFRIPVPLRQCTDNQSSVAVGGATVGAALKELTARHPDLKQYLYDDGGDFATSTYESMNLLLGKQDVRELQGHETPVGDGDTLLILRSWPAAISGGRQWNKPVGAAPPA